MSPETTVQDIVFMRAVVIDSGVATVWDTQNITLGDLQDLYNEILRERGDND